MHRLLRGIKSVLSDSSKERSKAVKSVMDACEIASPVSGIIGDMASNSVDESMRGIISDVVGNGGNKGVIRKRGRR